MHRNGNFRKIAKIFILAFLCSEMQSNFMQHTTAHNRMEDYTSTINGTEATQENAKHQASIRLTAQDNLFGEGHICGGAIIAPSVVLTAAHCVFNYDQHTPHHPSQLKVVMGTLRRYQRNEHTLVYGVTHIYRPKTFDPKTLRDNIAIIMLERDIPEEHPTVQPIAWHQNVAQMIETGATHAVTSWGATVKGLPVTQLLSLNVTKLSDQICLENYGALYAAEGMFCMGFSNTTNLAACPVVDAGAPLLHNNQLLALTSYGSGCDAKALPAVYTDVAYHSKWIYDIIGDGSNQNSSIWGTLVFLLFTAFTLKSLNLVKFSRNA